MNPNIFLLVLSEKIQASMEGIEKRIIKFNSESIDETQNEFSHN